MSSIVRQYPDPDRQGVRRWLAELVEAAGLAERNGRLLYSCESTLRPGPVYFLGLNPGGDPASLGETIAQDLDHLAVRPARWSAFLDEPWGGSEPGSRPLQTRSVCLFGVLGLEPRDVPASNLIFVRSKSAALTTEPPASLARLCWPVHEAILRVVRPTVVLVHGIRTLELLLDLSAKAGDPEAFPCGNASLGSCRVVRARLAARVVTVIGFPHLSRWAINSKTSAAALEWIRLAYAQAIVRAERDNSSDPRESTTLEDRRTSV